MMTRSLIPKKRSLMLVGVAVLALASTASADVLWDRSSFDPFGGGYFNVDAGSPPFGLTWHTVNHVTVGGGGWVIDSISTIYSGLDPGWGTGIVEGYLHIYPKTGSLPDASVDPTLSPLVPMSASLETDHWRVTVTGLAQAVGQGEYWIGITPIAGAGPFGPEIHLASLDPPTGDDSASYDAFAMPGPPAWFAPTAGQEATLIIEGDFAVPVEAVTWTGIKAQYR